MLHWKVKRKKFKLNFGGGVPKLFGGEVTENSHPKRISSKNIRK